jgi:hypothetical protein
MRKFLSRFAALALGAVGALSAAVAFADPISDQLDSQIGTATAGLEHVATTLGTQGIEVMLAAIGVGALIFGVLWLWKRFRGGMGR